MLITSTYMPNLMTQSPTYLQKCPRLYYKNISMIISNQGHYEFIINSTVGIVVKIYKHYFYFQMSDVNLSLHYNHRHVNGSIKFTASFLPDEIYYLIVATASRKTISSLSVTAIGPARINFNELGEH